MMDYDFSALDAALDALRANPAEAREPLAQLVAAAKKQAERARIKEALMERAPLYTALRSEQPKVRKNAARLIGALAEERDAAALLAALAAEAQRFVRPAMILALGQAGGGEAYAALAALPLPAGEEKHDREEAEALRLALARLAPMVEHAFRGFQSPRQVFLACAPGFEDMLIEELQEAGFSPGARVRGGVFLKTAEIERLQGMRCQRRLRFPLAGEAGAENMSAEEAAHALGKAIRVPYLALLEECQRGGRPYSYRIEYAGRYDRAAFAGALARALDPSGTALRNAPARYESELVVFERGGKLSAQCTLGTIPDTRFSYRLHPISASMQPALAAAIARYARRFAPDRPLEVLDPCCGSGTLLIELEKRGGCKNLIGLDLVRETAEKAKANCAAAGSRAHILHKDLKQYASRAPVDLVLSNLPFGLRVGSHENNEALYAALLKKLKEWLAPDGVALLYTMERRLLLRTLEAEKGFKLRESLRTEAGGLEPWILVLERG